MALNIGEGLRGMFRQDNLGKNTRAAADKLDGLKQKRADAAGQPAATNAVDENAETEAAAESAKTAPATPRFGARENKFIKGMLRQTGETLDRLNGKSTRTADEAAASFQNFVDGLDGAPAANNAVGCTDAGTGTEAAAVAESLDEAAAATGSAGAKGLGSDWKYQATQFQFSLNLSVVQSISTANGVTQNSFNMSLKMDASWASLGVGTGTDALSGVTDFLKNLGFGGLADAFGTSSANGSQSSGGIWDGFLDYYSPQNTADRILNFAMAFYPGSDYAAGGDTEENRQAFADYMGAAIQKGFDQAMGILGKVDSKTQSGIDETHKIVFKGLEDFVKNGTTGQAKEQAKKEEQEAIYASAQSWQLSLQMNYSYTSTTYSANGQPAASTTSVAGLNAEA